MLLENREWDKKLVLLFSGAESNYNYLTHLRGVNIFQFLIATGTLLVIVHFHISAPHNCWLLARNNDNTIQPDTFAQESLKHKRCKYKRIKYILGRSFPQTKTRIWERAAWLMQEMTQVVWAWLGPKRQQTITKWLIHKVPAQTTKHSDTEKHLTMNTSPT